MGKNEKSTSEFPWKELLSFLGVVLVAYLGYLGIRSQIQIPIQATQTAEAKLMLATQINVASGSVELIKVTASVTAAPASQATATTPAVFTASPPPIISEPAQPTVLFAEYTELEVVDHNGTSVLLLDPAILYPSTFGPSKLTEGILVRRGMEATTLLWSQMRILKFQSRQETNEKGTTVWRYTLEATLADGKVVNVDLQDDWNMAYMGGGGTGLLFGQTDLGESQIPFSDIATINVLSNPE
jgi:hypothetical protein